MALQTITTIKIGEIIITNFSHLKVNQKIHDHHTFSIEVRQDLLVSEFQSVMPVSQQLYGERISIEIKPLPGLEDVMIINNPKDYLFQFYGIVTEVSLKKSRTDDMEETILIEGCSRSLVLDNGPQSNSFTNMTMKDIVDKVIAGYDIDMEVVPFFKDILAYTVQYNESDFDFLNRLAKRYGQWFYDNGRVLVLGDPHGVVLPELVYGGNMYEFNYRMKLIPSLFKVLENDNKNGEVYTDSPIKYRKETDGTHQNYLNKSNEVFSKETIIQLNQNAVGGHGGSSVEEYSKNPMRSSMGKMMEIRGSSEVPGIAVGSWVNIKGVDKWLETTYTITQITHTCDDGGDYMNHFTAVNLSGSVFSPETDPDLVPTCKSQTAIVTANADPDGLSGVKVQMPWQEAKGETTPYIPLLQKYGGQARGQHIVPEIGDTVFVDFQGGNAELPIVTGTMTSRKEKSGFSTPDNRVKAWKFRFGQLLKFVEKIGIWLSDPSGNEIHLDEENKNINATTPETFTIRAKNIVFEATESITYTAGMNIYENAGVNKSTVVSGILSTHVTGDNFLHVGGNHDENIEGDLKSHTEKERYETGLNGIQNNSEKNVSKHAKNNIENNSGENTTHN